ncbi:cyclophane-containing peptide 2OG-Fe(II) oxygenase YhhC [Alcaligenes faecalis]|uniref:cyclophane-containing peptide 2OG-Fe(II) oxygenase YhhC n=1 Tax=Alcaligenes faecalis TaxID=511 RepID=UPI00364AE6DA
MSPFRYSLIPECLSPDICTKLLEWLEADAPWSLRIADFYEQHEFSFDDVKLPTPIAEAFSQTEMEKLRSHVEQFFNTSLSSRIDVTAHRLTYGQRIRIHNDFIPGEESHRLLIQLNRGWQDSNGGMLVFFNSNNPADIHRVLRPLHNSGVLFEISPASLHAVTPIQDGQRFTLVLSFFPSSKCTNSETPSSTV